MYTQNSRRRVKQSICIRAKIICVYTQCIEIVQMMGICIEAKIICVYTLWHLEIYSLDICIRAKIIYAHTRVKAKFLVVVICIRAKIIYAHTIVYETYCSSTVYTNSHYQKVKERFLLSSICCQFSHSENASTPRNQSAFETE